MAETFNRVPESVSYPIPGFEEFRIAEGAKYERAEARRQQIEAERRYYLRQQHRDAGALAQAKLMRDLNPLTQAAEFYAGEMAARGLKAVGKAVFSGKMRPGFVSVRNPLATGGYVNPGGGISMNQAMEEALRPFSRVALESTADRTMQTRYGHLKYFGATGEPGSMFVPLPQYPPDSLIKLGRAEMALKRPVPIKSASTPSVWFTGADYAGALKPAVPNPARDVTKYPARVVAKYEEYASTMRNLFKDQRSRKTLAEALRTGVNTDSPVFKLYEETRAGLQKTRSALSAYQEKAAKARFHDALVEEAKRFKTDAQLAKELRADPVKATSSVRPGELFPKVVGPWLKAAVRHPVKNYGKAFILGTIAAGAMSGGAALSWKSKISESDKAAEEKQKRLDEVHKGYERFTSDDSVRAQMSDAKALRESLIGMRTQALAELGVDSTRGPDVRARIESYLGRVKDSAAMTELISNNELGYRAFSQSDDYAKEFRERYRDLPSQATGMDYFSGF